MNRKRSFCSSAEAPDLSPFPEAMLLSLSPGIDTDTVPLPAPLGTASRSTIADVTNTDISRFSTDTQ